jgi:hypothetical protein
MQRYMHGSIGLGDVQTERRCSRHPKMRTPHVWALVDTVTTAVASSSTLLFLSLFGPGTQQTASGDSGAGLVVELTLQARF